MRDILLLMALLAMVPLAIRAPFVGALIWAWVALMNPHREVYSFLSGFQLNFYIAIITAGAWLISKERKFIPNDPVVILLALFSLWTFLTTWLGLAPDYSAPLLDRTTKTIILGLVLATLITNRIRIHALIWVIVISLGFFAVKGGGFTLLTAGANRVFGPDDSMIADNNNLGLVLVMTLPLINYLRTISKQRAVRIGCVVVIGLTLVAIVGTYSRGALLAAIAMGAMYVVKSRRALIPAIIAVGLIVALPSVMPQSWFKRMDTIQKADADASFEGRLQAWRTSWNIALARPLIGGGFSAIEVSSVVKKFETPGSLTYGKAAHSIYFEVLGDHGFVGFALYMGILIAAWINIRAVLRHTRDKPHLEWASQLGRMMQVSMVGYLVGGAALSMAYYDGFIILLVLTASLRLVVERAGETISENVHQTALVPAVAGRAPVPNFATARPRWRQ